MAPAGASGVDLDWVWKEVRKRVFIKLEYNASVYDAMEAAVPIVLEGDLFVVGLSLRDFPMARSLNAGAVHNTIENILRQAAGRPIRFDVIEGTTLADWHHVLERRIKAEQALTELATQGPRDHHLDDLLNQIVGEIRHQVSQVHDRTLPMSKASLVLDVAASLADAQDMLFPEAETRETKRAMSRVIDRVSNFIEVPPLTLAIEVERNRRAHKAEHAARATVTNTKTSE
jgi:hypothetical protein